MEHPKNKRQIDKKYLQYVKNQPCLICGKIPCDAHHIQTRGAFGSDYSAICLCREHHNGVHSMGKDTFQEKYNINFDKEIIRLLIGYIKKLRQKKN